MKVNFIHSNPSITRENFTQFQHLLAEKLGIDLPKYKGYHEDETKAIWEQHEEQALSKLFLLTENQILTSNECREIASNLDNILTRHNFTLDQEKFSQAHFIEQATYFKNSFWKVFQDKAEFSLAFE